MITFSTLSNISFFQGSLNTQVAGVYFKPQPVLKAIDRFGNDYLNANISISASLDSNCALPSDRSMVNNIAISNSTGWASLVNLYYTRAELIYLKATSGIMIF